MNTPAIAILSAACPATIRESLNCIKGSSALLVISISAVSLHCKRHLPVSTQSEFLFVNGAQDAALRLSFGQHFVQFVTRTYKYHVLDIKQNLYPRRLWKFLHEERGYTGGECRL